MALHPRSQAPGMTPRVGGGEQTIAAAIMQFQ
jgi:hypothetical protein